MTKEQRAYAAQCAAMMTSDIELSAEAKRKLAKAIDDLIQELDDYDRTHELQWKRMGEATERWRAEDPAGRSHIMPDLGRLLEWLMQQIDSQKEAVSVRNSTIDALAQKVLDIGAVSDRFEADGYRMDALEKFLKAGHPRFNMVALHVESTGNAQQINAFSSEARMHETCIAAASTLREAVDQFLSRSG